MWLPLQPLSETGDWKALLQHRISNFFTEKFADSGKVTTFATPFGNGGVEKFFYNFGFQIFQKKFADSKKVITFAIPIAREGLAISRKAGFFSAKLEKIIEKTDKNKYKQVPRN